jgi:hypothetical protein
MAKTPKTTATTTSATGTDAIKLDDPNEGLSPAQVAVLDHDNNGFAGGSLPVAEKLATAAAVVEKLSPVKDDFKNPDPTVGRIVHYYANSEATGQAAIVIGVSDLFERMVHLNVFTYAGVRVVNDVPYVDDLTQDGPAWRWPGFGYTAPPELANVDLFPGQKVFGEVRKPR